MQPRRAPTIQTVRAYLKYQKKKWSETGKFKESDRLSDEGASELIAHSLFIIHRVLDLLVTL